MNLESMINDKHLAWPWWCTPLIPALSKQRKVDLCEFETSLVYRASSRTARATQRSPVSKNKKKKDAIVLCKVNLN